MLFQHEIIQNVTNVTPEATQMSGMPATLQCLKQWNDSSPTKIMSCL